MFLDKQDCSKYPVGLFRHCSKVGMLVGDLEPVEILVLFTSGWACFVAVGRLLKSERYHANIFDSSS